MPIKSHDGSLMDGHRGICNETGEEHPHSTQAGKPEQLVAGSPAGGQQVQGGGDSVQQADSDSTAQQEQLGEDGKSDYGG